jgi:hypothetical protein
LRLSLFVAFPPITYMNSSSPYSCYVSSTSHSPWLDHSNYTWQKVEMKLFVRFFSPSCYFIPPPSKYSTQYPVLKHPLCYFFNIRDQGFKSIQNHRQIVLLYILIFTFLNSRREGKVLDWMVTSITRIQPPLTCLLTQGIWKQNIEKLSYKATSGFVTRTLHLFTLSAQSTDCGKAALSRMRARTVRENSLDLSRWSLWTVCVSQIALILRVKMASSVKDTELLWRKAFPHRLGWGVHSRYYRKLRSTNISRAKENIGECSGRERHYREVDRETNAQEKFITLPCSVFTSRETNRSRVYTEMNNVKDQPSASAVHLREWRRVAFLNSVFQLHRTSATRETTSLNPDQCCQFPE